MSVRRGGAGLELHQAHVRFRDGAVVAVAEADDADAVTEADGRGVRERLIDQRVNRAWRGGGRQALDGPIERAVGGDVPAVAAVQAAELAGLNAGITIAPSTNTCRSLTPFPAALRKAARKEIW